MSEQLGRCLFKTNCFEFFFHPAICHVCKSKGHYLLPCPDCHLIFYCSMRHLQMHRQHHMVICNVMWDLQKERNMWNTSAMTSEEWFAFKKKNVECMEQKLNRPLSFSEKRIFLQAKSCLVCRTQKNLTACRVCGSAYVCTDHELPEHDCEKLKQSVDLDFYYVFHVEKVRDIPDQYKRFNKDTIHDMRTFVQLSLRQTGRKCTRNLENDIYSEIFSKPLSAIQALLRLQLYDLLENHNRNIIIYIIVKGPVTKQCVQAWEIILHIMCPKTLLILVVLGTELWISQAISKINESWIICEACRNASKAMLLFDFNYFYNQPLLTKFDKTPDIIVTFDIEFSIWKQATKVIRFIQTKNCPIILTSTSEAKANNNVTMIRETLGSNVNPVVIEENKFASLRPHRDSESDSVLYSNAYLTIYRDLNGRSDSAASSGESSTVNNDDRGNEDDDNVSSSSSKNIDNSEQSDKSKRKRDKRQRQKQKKKEEKLTQEQEKS